MWDVEQMHFFASSSSTSSFFFLKRKRIVINVDGWYGDDLCVKTDCPGECKKKEIVLLLRIWSLMDDNDKW